MANWKEIYNSVNSSVKKKKKEEEGTVQLKASDLSSNMRNFLDKVSSNDALQEEIAFNRRLNEIEKGLLDTPEFATTKKAKEELAKTAARKQLNNSIGNAVNTVGKPVANFAQTAGDTLLYAGMNSPLAAATPSMAVHNLKNKKDDSDDDRTWFKNADLFDDGWQFGDLWLTAQSSFQDVLEEINEGVVESAENVIDTGAYLYGGAAGLLGFDDTQEEMADFIARDIIDSEYLVQTYNPFFRYSVANLLGHDVEDASIFGEKSDSLANSGGQLLTQVGLQAAGVPWWVTSGVTSFGSGTEQQLAEGASYGQAGGIGLVNAGAEILTEKLFGDSILGEKGLIDMGGLTKGISNKTMKLAADYGLTWLTNGTEEVGSEVFSRLGEAIIKEENAIELLTNEEALDAYLESFIGGMVMSGVTNAPKAVRSHQTGTDYNTGLTADEESVVNKEVEKRIAEQEKDGKKLSKNEKGKIFQSVIEAMDEGSLSTDLIEEVLGGDTYKTYKDTVASEESTLKEFQELYQGEELEQQIKDLKANSKLGDIKKQLGSEVFDKVKGSRLSETYIERGRRGQKFTADLSKYDEKQGAIIQKAIDSGILNNTRRTHKFVDWIAKVSADKGVLFDFVNNEKLKNSGFAVDGKTVNGYVTENGDVVLNVQSAKALNTTVGHEITHVLEGTELYNALASEIKSYAESRKASDSKFANEYIERLYNTRELYKTVKGYEGVDGHEKIKREVVADLVGDYLFTDGDFVMNLSAKNRNLFQKMYDEIKYLYKTITAGSTEAERLLAVKKAFEDAYRATTNTDEKNVAGTKYSLENVNKRKYNSRSRYSESETLFLSWENGSAPVGEVKKFVRYGKTHYYEKTESGCVELSRSQYNERNGVDVEKNYRRAERRISATVNNDESTQRGLLGDSDRHRDTNGNATVFGQTLIEKLRNDTAGSEPIAPGHDSRNSINQSEYNEEAPGDSGASFITFSNDYATIRNFMKNGDVGEATDPDVQYSLGEDVTINSDNFYELQREVNQLTESIREFESSAEWKAQMDKVSESMANGDTEKAIQGYMRYIEESGYNALTNRRNALRDALDKYARKAEEDRVNEAVSLERKAIEESGLSEADYFRKQAVKEFGYTPYFYDAGYIVTNGKMLNFSGEKGQHFGSRGQDHRAIETIFADTERSDALFRFVSQGNIRIVPESPGLDVSSTVEPTSEQYATIKRFVYQYADKGYFSIDISDNNGKVVGTLDYENRIYPAKVIDDLKHYYKTGEVRQQSSLGSFRYSLSEDSSGVEHSSEMQYAPTFYSQMAKVVDGVKQEKLGAASVVNMLRGKGIKAEEIKWSGIEQFLEGKKSVTKAELQEFIAGSQLQIEETVLDDGEGTISYTEDEQHDLQAMSEWISRRMDQAKELWQEAYGEEIPLNVLFADDTASAITREIIERNGGIRGFRGVDDISEAERTLFTEVTDGIRRLDLQIANIRERAEARQKNTSNTHWGQYRLEGGENYREYLFKMPGSDYRNLAMDAHWTGETGVLAHARVQDFDTPYEKMLFIEEIQSDWHNAGHKNGYTDEATRTKIRELEDQIAQVDSEVDAIDKEYDAFLYRYWEEDLSEDEYTRTVRGFQEAKTDLSYKRKAMRQELDTLTASLGVPDAPFSNNYHEYVLKRLIREAAEKGYDSIGWTPADIQSDRWSSEYAEGYRIEYDQDIPKFLNKYGKKWGASVSKTDIQTKQLTQDQEANLYFMADMLEDGESYIRDKKGIVEVWYMPITEAMKQSVLYEGQPQYSLSKEGETPKTYGNYNVYGNDISLEEDLPIRQDVAAPVAETPVAETPAVEDDIPIAETVADPLPDNLPMADYELNTLTQQKEALEEKMLAMSEKGDFGDEFYQLNEQWVAVTERVKALESEIAERDADYMDSFDDADAPPIADRYNDSTADIIPITKKLANDIAREVRAKLGLGNKHMADVHSIIDEYSNSEFPNREQLFEELKDKFGTYEESTMPEEYIKDAKKLLRRYPIRVDESVKKGIPDFLTDFKKRNKYKLLLRDDASMGIDEVYSDLHDAYPDLFPIVSRESDVETLEGQLKRMEQVANMADSVTETRNMDDEAIYEVADAIINSVSEYRNVQREKAANKYGRESFNGLMQDADQYVPPIDYEQVLNNRWKPFWNTEGYTAEAEIYDTQHKKGVAEGQQAMWDDPVPKVITRQTLHQDIVDGARTKFAENGLDMDEVLKNAKDLSTFATVDNTPQRVMEKALGYKAGQVLSDITVNKVAQNETEGIKWLSRITDRKNGFLAQLSKQYNIKPGSKESAAAQMYAEGFYVNGKNEIVQYGDAELAQDFRDSKKRANIKALARDPRIRQFYDATLAMINESRKRNAYPEIPRLDNYFLHFRAMDDTFSRLGLPFNPNDIRAKDLPTDLNGVTADLKPGQPYFASAMHRMGKRTSFDLLGGLERYATSAKNQIYHIDDIQTLRALRNYIADTYGQANGLEGLDALTEEEAQDRIEQVYNSHLSTFAKFLNEEANVLAGKTSLIDRGLEGIIGRRGITFLNTINQQVGKNMVGFNVSSSLTNFLPVAQTFAKTNKFDFLKAFAQTASSKVGSIFGKTNTFAESSPVMIRRNGADSFYRTPWQKVSDAGYVFMSAVDSISTELIARTKYNELTRKGMDSQQAHIETDKWVSRLMGDRSLGQQPQLYNSKMLGLVTKFQLEVRNQLDSQFYDTIQETKASTEDIQNGLARNAKRAAKITSTFVQLAVAQHLFGKAFESVAGYNPAFDIIDVLIKTFGWDDDEEDEDTVLDNIEEGFLALLGDMPYTSTLTGGRIPISSALPIKQLVTGEDDYGNEVSRWDTIKETVPYYLLPGGYGQAKKTVQGLKMFDDDLPIAGSYTDSGNLRFPVEDTFGNRLQAGIFGQYASENARDYFDNERDPLKEKQIEEFIDVDIPIRDYWEYREGLSDHDTLSEKADYIDGLDLPISKKNILINNIADRKESIDMKGYGKYSSFEEFDFAEKNPEKYQFLQDRNISWSKYVWNKEEYNYAYNNTEMYDFLQENGVSYKQYKSFDEDTKDAFSWAKENPGKYAVSRAISSDFLTYYGYKKDLGELNAKDANGNTVSGLKKQRVFDYIENLDLDYGEKIILYRSMYDSKSDKAQYNADILEYLNSRNDLTYLEKKTILEELDFKVSADGTVTW